MHGLCMNENESNFPYRLAYIIFFFKNGLLAVKNQWKKQNVPPFASLQRLA